jgi:hypothetical protein
MRPSNATITSITPVNKVVFQYLLDNYKSRGARDANEESLEVLVAWADADDFLEEAVGFTQWDGKSPNFNRVLPLAHPLRPGFWCIEYRLTDFGAYVPDRTDFNDPENNNAPAQDWCIYQLTYIKPDYWVVSDSQLANIYGNLETHRYCRYTEIPRPRERRQSGFIYEFDNSAAQDWSDPKGVPDESSFIQDHQIDLCVTLLQVPISAVPYNAILLAMNTVNKNPMQLTSGGREWNTGELLFKGLARPYAMYCGADDRMYIDIEYLFTAWPGAPLVKGGPLADGGGWQNYITRNAAGDKVAKRVRLRTPTVPNPNIPPYPSSDLLKLFAPGSPP